MTHTEYDPGQLPANGLGSAARADVALVALTHNLASQIFYDEIYSLPTGLAIRAEAYTDRVDLRSAGESPAATIRRQGGFTLRTTPQASAHENGEETRPRRFRGVEWWVWYGIGRAGHGSAPPGMISLCLLSRHS